MVEVTEGAFASDGEIGLACDWHCRRRGGGCSLVEHYTLTSTRCDLHHVLAGFLVSFAGMVVVHELLHVAVHPMSGRSPHSIVGFGPSIGFYGHYSGEMTRNRFVAILLAPLVVISFVPLLVAAVAQVTSGWVAFISAFNAFCACADIFDAGLVLFQIPATAMFASRA